MSIDLPQHMEYETQILPKALQTHPKPSMSH